jgi:hypothetical protein
MEKITYKDFKEGQIVTCVKLPDDPEDFYHQHLTVGKKYKIEDVDFHFPDAIVVRSDNNKVSMFMPIEFFTDVKYMRKLKLEKINKSAKN